MTEEQVIAILLKMNVLDPSIAFTYTEDQLRSYIAIAEMAVDAMGQQIPDERYVLVMAVKTLSLLSIPENSSLSKKKIKDVEVTYFQGQGRNKWDVLLDSLLGDSSGDDSLNYVGV